LCAIPGCHVGDDQILVTGHAELAFQDFGDFAYARLELLIILIPQAAGFNVQAQMPVAIFSLFPTKAITIAYKGIGAGRLQRKTGTLLDLVPEPFQAIMINGVLEASVLSL